MPIEYQLNDGGLVWIKNPITGVISYVVDLRSKSFAYTLGVRPPLPSEAMAEPATLLSDDEIALAKAACPFCPGNEHRAPAEILRIGDPGAPAAAWKIRAFNNLFPRIPAELTGGRNESYIIVEDPRHFLDTPVSEADLLYSGALDEDHFVRLMGCAAEISHLALSNPAVRSVVVRKNQGRESGASQPHIHQQVVGSPVPLPVLAAEAAAARAHPGLFSELLELVEGLGLVIEKLDGVVSYTSPIGAFPRSYDVIVPEYRGLLGDLDQGSMALFARALHRVIRVMGPMPLDYEIHQGEGLPLHAHVNGRQFPYSNVAGTLNLPRTLLESTAAIRRALGRHR